MKWNNLGIIASLLLFAAACCTARAANQPHIILFIADDFSWHDCGPYRTPNDAHTPRLDALAKQSLRFEQAFAASPTCTPSRSSMYTGLYPMRNGAHANHSLIKEGIKTLPAYMRELGYRVVIAGKTHIGPRSAFPFEYLPDSNIMPPGKHEILWTDLNTAAVEKLLAEHDKKTPLCLLVCSHSPHVYWPPNDGYDPDKLTLVPYLLDTRQTREAMCRYLTDVTHMDSQVGEVLDSLEKHGYADDTIFIFTADQGAQFPFAKWNLYDAGIRVPLMIRWPGVTLQSAKTRALVSLVDLLPTMIQAAGGTPPDDLDGRSLLPVLRAQSDSVHDAIFAAHTGDGKMNRSPQRCIRTSTHKLIENLAPQSEYRTHIDAAAGPDGRDYWDSWVRLADTGDKRARIVLDVYRHRPPLELYMVDLDLYEQGNVAGEAAFADVQKELHEKLRQWRLQQGEDLNKVPMPEDARQGDVPYAN
jgi:arylsulfatase A-like enzyme